ncbi:MAG: hypothetical protein R6U57_03185 [Anaerolineales bacterium]
MITKDRFDGNNGWKIFQDEIGASLVEILVAVSISLMVIGVLTTSLIQFMLVTGWGNDQLLVSNDLQISGIWLGRDAVESSTFTPGSGTEYGTLNWEDSSRQFRYSYNPTEDALVREHLQEGAVQSTITVARHIAVQGDVVFSVNDHLLTVSITSTSGNVQETITLSYAMRSR